MSGLRILGGTSNSQPATRDKYASRDSFKLPSGSLPRPMRQISLDQIQPSESRRDERELAAGVFVTLVLSLVVIVPMAAAGLILHFK